MFSHYSYDSVCVSVFHVQFVRRKIGAVITACDGTYFNWFARSLTHSLNGVELKSI